MSFNEQRFIPLIVERIRYIQKGLVIKPKGYDSRNDVERLKGAFVYVNRNDLPELNEDEFYLADLEGLKVVDKKNNPIGKVGWFFYNGAHHIMVVYKKNNPKKQIWVPFVKDAVIKIDDDLIVIDTDLCVEQA